MAHRPARQHTGNTPTQFVNGIDCGRNHLRKDNAFFVTDFGVARPFQFHDGRWALESRAEVFNIFNNKNNLNSLSSPALLISAGFYALEWAIRVRRSWRCGSFFREADVARSS